MKLFDKLSAKAKVELLKDAGVYDSLDDLYRSLHLMSVDQLKDIEDQIKNIIEEHNKKFDLSYEPTPLDEFEFCDDIMSLASIADSFDKIKCFEAADIIDGLIEKLAKKNHDFGRAYAKAVRKVRKLAITSNCMLASYNPNQKTTPLIKR
ncbi:MAG: hypothetical protein WC516_05630 [Patescibacteria group bacterium]|jgi:hypothetical protein